MNKMTVSPLLIVSPQGPKASSTKEMVHLRQGDLDGACGPYCLFMALIALGLLNRHEATHMSEWDGRSREGKLREALKDFGSLISNGTYGSDLVLLTDFFKVKRLSAKHVQGSKKHVFQVAAEAIAENRLPVIGVRWSGGGSHWLLVIGFQGVEQDGELQLTHLLCLDPGHEAPKTSLWNAVIEVFNPDGSSVNSGRLTSDYWGISGEKEKCQIEETVILTQQE